MDNDPVLPLLASILRVNTNQEQVILAGVAIYLEKYKFKLWEQSFLNLKILQFFRQICVFNAFSLGKLLFFFLRESSLVPGQHGMAYGLKLFKKFTNFVMIYQA